MSIHEQMAFGGTALRVTGRMLLKVECFGKWMALRATYHILLSGFDCTLVSYRIFVYIYPVHTLLHTGSRPLHPRNQPFGQHSKEPSGSANVLRTKGFRKRKPLSSLHTTLPFQNPELAVSSALSHIDHVT